MTTLVKGIDIEKLSKQFDPSKEDYWDSFIIESTLISDNTVVQNFKYNIRVLLKCNGKLPIQLTGELALQMRKWAGLSTGLVLPVIEATLISEAPVWSIDELLSNVVEFLGNHVDFDKVILIDLIKNESVRMSWTPEDSNQSFHSKATPEGVIALDGRDIGKYVLMGL